VETLLIVVLVIALALFFDFTNGFHDTANAMATPIATGALRPKVAVTIAAILNLVGAFLSTEVARTISGGIIKEGDGGVLITPELIFAGLIGAIVWNLVTWYVGLPSSSSHALLGGFAGAAIAKAGIGSLILSGWVKPILGIVISPLLGATLGLALTVGFSWLLYKKTARPLDKLFRRLQLVSAGLYSLSHGANDAQKTMGIIVGLLVSVQHLFKDATGWQRHLYLANADHVPLWVELSAYSAIAMGT